MQQVTCTAEQPEGHSDGQLRFSGVAAFLDGLLDDPGGAARTDKIRRRHVYNVVMTDQAQACSF